MDEGDLSAVDNPLLASILKEFSRSKDSSSLLKSINVIGLHAVLASQTNARWKMAKSNGSFTRKLLDAAKTLARNAQQQQNTYLELLPQRYQAQHKSPQNQQNPQYPPSTNNQLPLNPYDGAHIPPDSLDEIHQQDYQIDPASSNHQHRHGLENEIDQLNRKLGQLNYQIDAHRRKSALSSKQHMDYENEEQSYKQPNGGYLGSPARNQPYQSRNKRFQSPPSRKEVTQKITSSPPPDLSQVFYERKITSKQRRKKDELNGNQMKKALQGSGEIPRLPKSPPKQIPQNISPRRGIDVMPCQGQTSAARQPPYPNRSNHPMNQSNRDLLIVQQQQLFNSDAIPQTKSANQQQQQYQNINKNNNESSKKLYLSPQPLDFQSPPPNPLRSSRKIKSMQRFPSNGSIPQQAYPLFEQQSPSYPRQVYQNNNYVDQPLHAGYQQQQAQQQWQYGPALEDQNNSQFQHKNIDNFRQGTSQQQPQTAHSRSKEYYASLKHRGQNQELVPGIPKSIRNACSVIKEQVREEKERFQRSSGVYAGNQQSFDQYQMANLSQQQIGESQQQFYVGQEVLNPEMRGQQSYAQQFYSPPGIQQQKLSLESNQYPAQAAQFNGQNPFSFQPKSLNQTGSMYGIPFTAEGVQQYGSTESYPNELVQYMSVESNPNYSSGESNEMAYPQQSQMQGPYHAQQFQKQPKNLEKTNLEVQHQNPVQFYPQDPSTLARGGYLQGSQYYPQQPAQPWANVQNPGVHENLFESDVFNYPEGQQQEKASAMQNPFQKFQQSPPPQGGPAGTQFSQNFQQTGANDIANSFLSSPLARHLTSMQNPFGASPNVTQLKHSYLKPEGLLESRQQMRQSNLTQGGGAANPTQQYPGFYNSDNKLNFDSNHNSNNNILISHNDHLFSPANLSNSWTKPISQNQMQQMQQQQQQQQQPYQFQQQYQQQEQQTQQRQLYPQQQLKQNQPQQQFIQNQQQKQLFYSDASQQQPIDYLKQEPQQTSDQRSLKKSNLSSNSNPGQGLAVSKTIDAQRSSSPGKENQQEIQSGKEEEIQFVSSPSFLNAKNNSTNFSAEKQYYHQQRELRALPKQQSSSYSQNKTADFIGASEQEGRIRPDSFGTQAQQLSRGRESANENQIEQDRDPANELDRKDNLQSKQGIQGEALRMQDLKKESGSDHSSSRKQSANQKNETHQPPQIVQENENVQEQRGRDQDESSGEDDEENLEAEYEENGHELGQLGMEQDERELEVHNGQLKEDEDQEYYEREDQEGESDENEEEQEGYSEGEYDHDDNNQEGEEQVSDDEEMNGHQQQDIGSEDNDDNNSDHNQEYEDNSYQKQENLYNYNNSINRNNNNNETKQEFLSSKASFGQRRGKQDEMMIDGKIRIQQS